MTDVYKESDEFVPDPTAQYGTFDTSATAGSAHAQIEEISPVFAVADKRNAETAAKALDDDDDSVPASVVTLPDSDRGYDDAVDAVNAKAKALADKDISLLSSNKTPAQEQAAETVDSPKASDKPAAKKAASSS